MSRLFDILKNIEERLVANKRTNVIALDSYTSSDYTFPSDGYLNVTTGAAANAQASASLYDADRNYLGEIGGLSNSAYTSSTTFVKKGMKVRVSGIANNGHINFYPLG